MKLKLDENLSRHLKPVLAGLSCRTPRSVALRVLMRLSHARPEGANSRIFLVV
jgi:hypothetical protein